MSSSATGVGMPICFLWAILLILTQKSSQKFGDVLGIMVNLSVCWLVLVENQETLTICHLHWTGSLFLNIQKMAIYMKFQNLKNWIK